MNIIICAAFNCLEYTKETYRSIFANTKTPFHFVLVANGCNDGTNEWIQSIPKDDRLTTYIHDKNEGCGIGRNVGMRLAYEKFPDADYYTFVDNDISATEGWDVSMIDFMNNNKDFGICGPMTNYAGCPQILTDHPNLIKGKEQDLVPRGGISEESIIKAQAFGKWYNGRYMKPWVVPGGLIIIGFCLMIRRECYLQLKRPDNGIFDEGFKLYGFEDTFFNHEVNKAGWRRAYWTGSYCHHFGSKSLDALSKSGLDWGKISEANSKLFSEKTKQK